MIQRYERRIAEIKPLAYEERRTRHPDGHQSFATGRECVSVSGSENSGRKLLAEMFDGKGVFVSGEAWVYGQRITDFHPQKLERIGVFYLGNDPAFMDCMDLAENFFLMRRSSHNKILLNNRAVHLRTAQVLQDFAMRYEVTSQTSKLHHLDRLLLSIVRAWIRCAADCTGRYD